MRKEGKGKGTHVTSGSCLPMCDHMERAHTLRHKPSLDGGGLVAAAAVVMIPQRVAHAEGEARHLPTLVSGDLSSISSSFAL